MSNRSGRLWPAPSYLLLLSLPASLLFWPSFARPLSSAVLTSSLGMAVFFIVQRHWQAYRQDKITRSQLARSLSLDLLGLLLTLAAATYAGGIAGNWAAAQAGLWAGLALAFAAGFLAAWGMRRVWSALSKLRTQW